MKCEANNSDTSTEEFTRHLCNSKFHYCVHKIPSQDSKFGHYFGPYHHTLFIQEIFQNYLPTCVYHVASCHRYFRTTFLCISNRNHTCYVSRPSYPTWFGQTFKIFMYNRLYRVCPCRILSRLLCFFSPGLTIVVRPKTRKVLKATSLRISCDLVTPTLLLSFKMSVFHYY